MSPVCHSGTSGPSFPRWGQTRAGAVLWCQGVCSSANHPGAPSICHLHFFQNIHIMRWQTLELCKWGVCLWPVLVYLCHWKANFQRSTWQSCTRGWPALLISYSRAGYGGLAQLGQMGDKLGPHSAVLLLFTYSSRLIRCLPPPFPTLSVLAAEEILLLCC